MIQQAITKYQSSESSETKMDIQDLIKKIKNYKIPECQEGELHEQLSQICVDVRCDPSKVFQLLCSGCIEDKIHCASHQHFQRQFKRVLLEIAEKANKESEAVENCQQIEEKLQEMVVEFKTLSEQCLQISEYLKESITEVSEKKLEDHNVKKEVLSQLEEIFVEDASELQTKIYELKKLLKISSDSIQIDNDKFEKEWAIFTNEQKLKITAAQQMALRIKATKIGNFLEDKNWIIQKGQANTPVQGQENEPVKQQVVDPISQLNTSGIAASPNSDIFQGKTFGFSTLLKSSTIQITNNKIAKQTQNCYSENRVALVEPPLHSSKRSFHAFQVIQQSGWMGIGLALKDIILRDNYKFTIEDINHGQFLVSSNGYKWVHNNDQETGTQIAFTFSQYDIILCEYDPSLRRIRFKKKGSDRMAVIQLDNTYGPNEELYLCVNLSEKNDAIGLFVESSDKQQAQPSNQ